MWRIKLSFIWSIFEATPKSTSYEYVHTYLHTHVHIHFAAIRTTDHPKVKDAWMDGCDEKIKLWRVSRIPHLLVVWFVCMRTFPLLGSSSGQRDVDKQITKIKYSSSWVTCKLSEHRSGHKGQRLLQRNYFVKIKWMPPFQSKANKSSTLFQFYNVNDKSKCLRIEIFIFSFICPF